MTQEEKQLLLKDLCGRLPYGVKILYEGWDSDCGCDYELIQDFVGMDDNFIYTTWRGERKKHSVNYMESIKPYLRPMSSMTDEEKIEILCVRGYVPDYVTESLAEKLNIIQTNAKNATDFYNEYHFDYRGLIEKGIALEAPEGMYKND